MKFKKYCYAGVSTFALVSFYFAQPANSQTFLSQGPSPSVGMQTNSRDLPPCAEQYFITGCGSTSGALSSILLDPNLGSNTIFATATNGGIWRTDDGGGNWAPLTDKQLSLSISSLSIDPTDLTGKTLLAGTGITDNGSYDQFNLPQPQGRGSYRNGLILSTDGGSTWSSIGANALANQSISDALARGSTILAATFEPHTITSTTASSGNYGLYRSTNSGSSFSLISGSAGLPTGAISSLVADPQNLMTFYAAVTSTNTGGSLYQNASIYKTTDAGATWTPVFNSATPVAGGSNIISGSSSQSVIKLSAGPNGSLAFSVVQGDQLAGLYLMQSSSSGWSRLATPNTNPGGQGNQNLAIQIDVNDPSIVYVAGDRVPEPVDGAYSGSVYKVQGNTATSIAGPTFTSMSTSIHADARAFAMDSLGNLYLTNDGGIYKRTSPTSNNGDWSGLNGAGLQVSEPYQVYYGANAKRLMLAQQDNGVVLQYLPNDYRYTTVMSGDGLNTIGTDTKFSGYTTYYYSAQAFGGLSRLSSSANGESYGADIKCNSEDCETYLSATFDSSIIINKVNSNKLALGIGSVYLGIDNSPIDAANVNLELTNIGDVGGNVSAIAYGSADNEDVVIAGSNYQTPGSPYPAGSIFISTASSANSLGYLPSYLGAIPTSIVIDQRSSQRFYVADAISLWGTSNQGTTISNLTGNLPTNIARPTSLEFINNNGVNALLVGGLTNTANARSQISVADSNTGGSLLNWRLFGNNLPNTLVSSLSYNSIADVLAVGLVGRGGWLLYDTTSFFSQAESLNFGLANNDSSPDASILVNGTNIDTSASFVRGLQKYGVGTLNIAGTATYTGVTDINEGRLNIAAGGSIASSQETNIHSGARLSGNGTVGNLSLLSGSLLSPGNSIGAIHVAQNLTFAPGSFYKVEVDQSGQSDRTVVSGATSIQGGTVQVSSIEQISPYKLVNSKYGILTSANGISGRFSSVEGLGYTFLSPNLSYSSTDVNLGWTLTPFSTVAKNINQRNVGNALTIAALGSVNALGAPILNALFLGNYQNAQSVMDTVSGSGLAGVQSAAMQVGEMVSSTVSDQIAFWRSGETQDATGYTSQEARSPRSFLAYAPVEGRLEGNGPIRIKSPSEMTAHLPTRTYRAWGSMFGGGANYLSDAGRGSAASIVGFYGGLVGVDYQVHPNLLIGAAVGGSTANFNVGSLSTNGALTGFHAGLYGAYTMGASYIALNETFSGYNNQTTRKAGGYALMPYEQLSAQFGSTEFRTRLESGHSLLMGGLKATPFVAAEVAAYHSNYFAEKSTIVASTFAVKNNGQSINSLPTFIGLRLSNDYTLENGWRLAPIGSVAYVHEFFPQRQFTNILMSMPGTDFNVSGPRSTYNLVQTKLGAQLNLTNKLALFTDFQGEYSAVSTSYGGKAGMKYFW